jgi:hypothetical protein
MDQSMDGGEPGRVFREKYFVGEDKSVGGVSEC